jgi:hypothetical protein
MTIGFFADEYGRERTIALASVVFIAGALLQAASRTMVQIVRRFAPQADGPPS